MVMEALFSSETSVLTRVTRRNIPENGILHSHRRENLKAYIYHVSDGSVHTTLQRLILDNGLSRSFIRPRDTLPFPDIKLKISETELHGGRWICILDILG
jgi:hypothetical protein